MCFGCSKEPSHRNGSFEYPQHMFLLGNKESSFQLRTLIWGPVDFGILWPYSLGFCLINVFTVTHQVEMHDRQTDRATG